MPRGIARVASIVATATIVLLGQQAFAKDHKYVGAKACGMCHKKELIGNQLAKWKESPHAKAYKTLEGDEAKKIAKEKGLSTPPNETDECLRCHATAQGLEKSQILRKPLKIQDGVQCESCHGPGSDYRKKKIMSDHDKAVAAGMWEPGKNEKVCTTCHNSESPTWDAAKGFDYAAMKKKIAHPIPKDVKGRYLEAEKEARKK
jgi:hypothetical protein